MPPIFYVSYAALWMLLLIQGVLLLLIYRHFGMISLGTVEGVQRDGLAVGELAPTMTGVTAEREPFEWTPQPGHAYLLAFVSPTCGPCAIILPALLQLAVVSREVEVLLIVDGPYERLDRLIEQFHPPAPVICLAEEQSRIYLTYQVRISPFAFAIGKDGRIYGKGLCDTTARLHSLLEAISVEIPIDLLGATQQPIPLHIKLP
jgi:hypothetical protein